MSVKSNILAAVVAGAILGVVSRASATTYDVNLVVGASTATGFFSAIIGNSNSDVGAPFNLTLTEGLTSITLVGSGGGNAQVVASPALGNAITVTANQVLFNFSDPDPEYVEFYLSSNPLIFLCFQTYAAPACGGTGPGIVIGASTDQFQSETGNQVIASATPIPAALPLFASVLGGMGFLGWRRKRKSAIRA
jgi:hypothetical protein